MPATRSKRRAAIGALVVVGGILAMWCFRNDSGSETRRIALLSDGSTFEIRTITLAKNFRYNHEAGNRLQRMLSEYPQWTPEPLPITKQDGDLSVALTKFASGVFDRSGAGGDAIAISPTLSLTEIGRRDLDRSGGFAGDDAIAPRLTRLEFVPI